MLVHPQSIVHGMVAFRDGSMIAQMSAPDMRMPIAHCLAWPETEPGPRPAARSCESSGVSTFERPDTLRFPALKLARDGP